MRKIKSDEKKIIFARISPKTKPYKRREMKYYLWLFRKYLSRLIFREFSILVYREKKGGGTDGLSGMMTEDEYVYIDLKGNISVRDKSELFN